MRLPVNESGRRELQFNITPLIDIVFLLIIFFLVASHFVRSENSAAVDLPVVSDASAEEDPAHRLTVTVLEDGSFSVSGEAISQEAVLQRISSLRGVAAEQGLPPEVRIRADRHGRFQEVRGIIEHCARHGIHSIQFAVTLDAV